MQNDNQHGSGAGQGVPEPYPPFVELLVGKLDAISKGVNDNDEDINRIDRDMASDRKDWEQVKANQQTLNAKLDSVLEILTRLQMKTKEAVKDSVSDEIAPMKKQIDKIVEKKVVRIKIPAEGFLTRFLRWVKGVKSIWI